MLSRLLRLYKRNDVLTDSGQVIDALPLHEACPDTEVCWADCHSGQADWNRIQLPFIGPSYLNHPARLLAVGLNLNGGDGGGLFFVHKLVVYAQALLLARHKKIHFGARDYAGSPLWHRLAAYSLLIVRPDWDLRDGELWLQGTHLLDSFGALSDALNYIAFTELIKCSPKGKKSKPTKAMRSRCPRRFLRNELDILAPRTILVLGIETAYDLPLGRCKLKARTEDSRIRLYSALLNDEEVSVISVFHPTARGGTSDRLVSDFAGFLVEHGIRA